MRLQGQYYSHFAKSCKWPVIGQSQGMDVVKFESVQQMILWKECVTSPNVWAQAEATGTQSHLNYTNHFLYLENLKLALNLR